MPNKQLKAFSLVEVLVTILLSSIVIAGAYSSYQMVDLQYIKNKEISDMHTQGRAVMRILERDIRMQVLNTVIKTATLSKVVYQSQ